MVYTQGSMIVIVAVIFVFSSASAQGDGQYITPTERSLRKNLTVLVQFVVHPTAEPSIDLINLALVMGRAPKTQQERMSYLNLLKEIGRKTPEFVKKYTTTTKSLSGASTVKIDEIGMDASITSKALEWAKKGPALLEAAQAESTATPNASQPAVNQTSNSTTTPNVPGASVSSTNTGSQTLPEVTSQNGVVNEIAVQNQQSNNLVPAVDGTVSLADVFNLMQQQNIQNNQIDPMAMSMFFNF